MRLAAGLSPMSPAMARLQMQSSAGNRTLDCEAEPVTARDLVHRTPAALLPHDNLETALRLCEANREEHIPVVDTERKVIGEVRYTDLVLAYNRALLEARAAERGES